MSRCAKSYHSVMLSEQVRRHSELLPKSADHAPGRTVPGAFCDWGLKWPGALSMDPDVSQAGRQVQRRDSRATGRTPALLNRTSW